MQSTKAVHQQHVNCLINTWVLPVKTWLLIACDTAFYAIRCLENIIHIIDAVWYSNVFQTPIKTKQTLEMLLHFRC